MAAQYRLTVVSARDSPNPTGTVWYDYGVSVTASVTSPADAVGGTRYRCTGFTGVGSVPASGVSNSVTFVISAPSSITWNWVTQYQLTVVSARDSPNPTGSVWYDSGVSVTASVTSPVESSGTRYQ